MDKKKAKSQPVKETKIEEEVKIEMKPEKKDDRGIETLDLNKAQVESFWFPGKGAKKEVVDEYINEAVAVLMPIVIGIIKSLIQMMPMQNVKYLIGLFLMLVDGYSKDVKRKLISSLLEDQEILRYYKDIMILPYEPIGEDAMKHVDDFKSIVHGPFMSVIAAIKATSTEASEEKEETKKKDKSPGVTIINEDTIFGKIRSFFNKMGDSESSESTEEKLSCSGITSSQELEEFKKRFKPIPTM